MAPRPFSGRKCISCGVRLFDAESARQTKDGFVRVDVCIGCETNGPPRGPGMNGVISRDEHCKFCNAPAIESHPAGVVPGQWTCNRCGFRQDGLRIHLGRSKESKESKDAREATS